MESRNRKIVIVGGKLQGMEVCYLAKKAGIETILVDKNPDAPAKFLCDKFLCQDLFLRSEEVSQAIAAADAVVPALENDRVLSWLDKDAREYDYILAFDWQAYKLSSSKRLSDQLFHRLGIPSPQHYPAGRLPYICKPVSESGSHGVRKLETPEALEEALAKREDLIIQEYINGPSYSIEIVGKPGNYRTYEITQIHMDEGYDCNRVTAPCHLPPVVEDAFRRMAVEIAETIHLHGIMDLEVIEHNGVLKILEIDARIPSQTPATVFHSSGMNLLEELLDIYIDGEFHRPMERPGKFVAYEHYLMKNGRLTALGEHIMVEGRPLQYMPGFCGADEAMTDYEPETHCWRGTFINWGDTKVALNGKHFQMLKEISALAEKDAEHH